MSAVIKNWDNKNWLSSKPYISSINKFLINSKKLNSNSKILDIGCGRGKILGSLSSILRLNSKPIGIDLVNHKDKDKRIKFKKIDALTFCNKNKKKFDLILIKQTIHLLKMYQIKVLLDELKKTLKPGGKIYIFTLNPHNNEIPSFKLMKKELLKSLSRDKKIFQYILKLYPKSIIKYFSFRVKISKKKYTQMISKRFISTLLHLSKKQISQGIEEIDTKFNKNLKFIDKLICIIVKNN